MLISVRRMPVIEATQSVKLHSGGFSILLFAGAVSSRGTHIVCIYDCSFIIPQSHYTLISDVTQRPFVMSLSKDVVCSIFTTRSSAGYEVFQHAAVIQLSQLLQRAPLYLPDTLSREAVPVSDLVERIGLVVSDAEPHPEYVLLPIRQVGERLFYLFRHGDCGNEHVGRRPRVGNKIYEAVLRLSVIRVHSVEIDDVG